MRLTSPAFADGAPIPERYTAYGAEVSPPLTWAGVPPGAQSLVVVCDDPDAPQRPFVHWVVYNIPPKWTGLPEDLPFIESPIDGVQQALNNYRTPGWGAPFPPVGRVHTYHFRLYALDCQIAPGRGCNHREVFRAMEGHILSEAALAGIYARSERNRGGDDAGVRQAHVAQLS